MGREGPTDDSKIAPSRSADLSQDMLDRMHHVMMGMAEKGGRKRGKGTKDWPDIAAMQIHSRGSTPEDSWAGKVLAISGTWNKYCTTFKCGLI